MPTACPTRSHSRAPARTLRSCAHDLNRGFGGDVALLAKGRLAAGEALAHLASRVLDTRMAGHAYDHAHMPKARVSLVGSTCPSAARYFSRSGGRPATSRGGARSPASPPPALDTEAYFFLPLTAFAAGAAGSAGLAAAALASSSAFFAAAVA